MACLCVGSQSQQRGTDRLIAAEKNRRVLEILGLEATKRGARP